MASFYDAKDVTFMTLYLLDTCPAMEDTDRHGRGDFFKMFRKKKKTKEFLLTCMNQLSLTTEEQTTIIRALTGQNNQHVQDTKQLQDKILTITTELQKLNDKNIALADTLASTETQLLLSERESETGKDRELVLEETNAELSAELRASDRSVGDLEKQVAVYQERFKFTEENNEALNKSVTELKDAVDVTKSENERLKLRLRTIEKDLQHFKEMAEYEKKTRIDTERRYDEIRKTWDNLRLYECSVQLDLDAENECLKFDVKTLTKKVKKMKEALNTIRRDKLLILSYYARQRGGFNQQEPIRFHGIDKTIQKLTIDTTDGSLVPSNQRTAEEIHPDVLDNITMKNKLLDLECRIYRRDQLIDELVRIIQENDPDFNIEDQPFLKIYLDETYSRKDFDEAQENSPGTRNEQGVYSSTLSSDNINNGLC